GGGGAGTTSNVALHEAAQSRYLNYALSVITARALPDVRDGLKPVQRRILYTMWQQNLTADVKHRKCAKVVGDVMGNFHPHGDMGNAQLCRYIKGPDFPTGGQILNSQDELKQIYKTGSGSIRLRGTWDIGPETRSTKTMYVESIPYTVDKSQLVAAIGQIIEGRKLPQLVDVKDLSTEDVRIAIEMKKDADEKMVMAYLFKHTALQINYAVNLTCLIPTENPEVGRPERLDLKQILWHLLHFRLEVVHNRPRPQVAARGQ